MRFIRLFLVLEMIIDCFCMVEKRILHTKLYSFATPMEVIVYTSKRHILITTNVVRSQPLFWQPLQVVPIDAHNSLSIFTTKSSPLKWDSPQNGRSLPLIILYAILNRLGRFFYRILHDALASWLTMLYGHPN